MQTATETFDVTARKFHQTVCVLLLVAAFIVGAHASGWIVGFVGLVLLVGRFAWQADIFRQLAWKVLEPAGILARREVQENHETRRVARVMGGGILLVCALLLAAGQGWAWIPIALIGIMISLDALFNFCALCRLAYQFDKSSVR